MNFLRKLKRLPMHWLKRMPKKDKYAKLYNRSVAKKKRLKRVKKPKRKAKEEDPVMAAVNKIKERNKKQ